MEFVLLQSLFHGMPNPLSFCFPKIMTTRMLAERMSCSRVW